MRHSHSTVAEDSNLLGYAGVSWVCSSFRIYQSKKNEADGIMILQGTGTIHQMQQCHIPEDSNHQFLYVWHLMT